MPSELRKVKKPKALAFRAYTLPLILGACNTGISVLV